MCSAGGGSVVRGGGGRRGGGGVGSECRGGGGWVGGSEAVATSAAAAAAYGVTLLKVGPAGLRGWGGGAREGRNGWIGVGLRAGGVLLSLCICCRISLSDCVLISNRTCAVTPCLPTLYISIMSAESCTCSPSLFASLYIKCFLVFSSGERAGTPRIVPFDFFIAASSRRLAALLGASRINRVSPVLSSTRVKPCSNPAYSLNYLVTSLCQSWLSRR